MTAQKPPRHQSDPRVILPALFQRRCCACKRIFTTHDVGQVQCDKCDQLQMVMP